MDVKQYTNNKPQSVAAKAGRPGLMVRLMPVWILLLTLVVTVALVALMRKPPENKPTPEIARLVETIEAQPQTIQYRIATYGTVQPRTETTMVAEVSGIVTQVSDTFAAGGFLSAGDVLLQIDPSDYQTALISAEANMASRQAKLSDEQARSDQARKDWKQLNSNREPNPLVLRLPQLEEAKAAVRSAEADVIKARRDLERTTIRMPYDGLVKARSADLGQYVTPGTAVGDVFAIDVAEIRLSLTDEDLGYVDLPKISTRQSRAQGPEVLLTANVGGHPVSWNGRIVRTEGVVDTNTRVVYSVAQVADPYGLLDMQREVPLKVGTFVSAQIIGKTVDNVVTVPRSILQPDNTLFVATSEGTLAVRQVNVTRSTPEMAYINYGLIPGDQIITTSIAAPIPGMAVRIDQAIEQNDDPIEGPVVAEQRLADASSGTGASQ